MKIFQIKCLQNILMSFNFVNGPQQQKLNDAKIYRMKIHPGESLQIYGVPICLVQNRVQYKIYIIATSSLILRHIPTPDKQMLSNFNSNPSLINKRCERKDVEYWNVHNSHKHTEDDNEVPECYEDAEISQIAKELSDFISQWSSRAVFLIAKWHHLCFLFPGRGNIHKLQKKRYQENEDNTRDHFKTTIVTHPPTIETNN